jgi:hypothetical protein
MTIESFLKELASPSGLVVVLIIIVGLTMLGSLKSQTTTGSVEYQAIESGEQSLGILYFFFDLRESWWFWIALVSGVIGFIYWYQNRG